MGRRKIEIQPITHERNRAVTFVKRKNGLFKKAYELGVLCSVDVAVIIFEDRIDQHPKLHQYCSSSLGIDEIVRRHRAHSGDTETRSPTDFGSAPAAGNRKAAAQDVDDDDEDEEDVVDVPVRGGRGKTTAGRAPNSASRPTPNVSAVRGAPAPPRRSLPLRQAAAKRRRYAEDDDDDEDGDEDDEYKRDDDEDAEGDEDGDGDYEYAGPGTSRRSGRMAEAAASLRRTGPSLPVSNDRGGDASERSSRNKRARVDAGPVRNEVALRSSGGDYAGSYRGEYAGAYREDHSSGFKSSGLRLHSRSRSPPPRSSYPYSYPTSVPGSSSYPPGASGSGSGSGYAPSGGPGYQSPGDIYSYPPPHPPPNAYPPPHTHAYPQQQSYTRAAHRPFHTGTGTASPIPGSPHPFSTSSPHPFPPPSQSQSQNQYPPLPGAHQNGYGTPPQLRLEPPLRGDDSYLRTDALYPPPARPDGSYLAPARPDTAYVPPPLPSQYTLPPLDPTGPAAVLRRTSPRKLRSHAQGRAHDGEDVVGRRAGGGGPPAGLASVLDLPPVHMGGGAPAWEGVGTTRELLNAFMAAPGPELGVERPAAAAGVAGDGSGEMDWPVHAPPAGKGVGPAAAGDSSQAEAGAVRGSGDQGAEGSAASGATANPELAQAIPEANTETSPTTTTTTEIDIKVDTQSTDPATSSNPASAHPAPEPDTSNPEHMAATPKTTGGSEPDQDKAATAEAASEEPSLLGAQLVTPAPPGGGDPNGVDWLDFLSGAAAEANAVGEWVAGRGDADAAKTATAPESGGGSPPGGSTGAGGAGRESAGMAVDMDADADDENAEDAEGEPDIEEDEGEMSMDMHQEVGEPSAAAAASVDSNASSSTAEVRVENASQTSSPKAGGELAEESTQVGAAGATAAEDVAREPLEDKAAKGEAGDAMAVDGAV